MKRVEKWNEKRGEMMKLNWDYDSYGGKQKKKKSLT